MADLHAIFFYPPVEPHALGHQMSEIYKENIYGAYLPNKKEGTVCLDIGGNLGLTSYYFSQYFERVITLEPAIEHFEVLVRMLEFNKIENVKPINKALYIKSGKYPLFHTPNKTSFSLHSALSNELGSEIVETTTLTELFEQEKIEHVDLMKMDVEGTETEIFSSSDFKEVVDKIDKIVTERHNWSGREPNQLNDALKMRGFEIQTIPAQADLLVAIKK